MALDIGRILSKVWRYIMKPWQNRSYSYLLSAFCFLLIVIIPASAMARAGRAAEGADLKSIEKRLKALEKQAVSSQIKSLKVLGSIGDTLPQRLEAVKRELEHDEGWNANLDITRASAGNIEKKREQLTGGG